MAALQTGQWDVTETNNRDIRIETVSRNWVTYLHSGDATPDKIAEFEVWLASDIRHARSYLEMEHMMGELALAMNPNYNEEDRTTVSPQMPSEKPGHFSGMAGAVLAAVAMVSMVLFFGVGALRDPAASLVEIPSIETETAEIRSIYLEDGTHVTLGARSKIEARFTDELRVVKLSEGEAFFDVASNKARPFYVEVGDRLIRVVGTQFAVRQGADDVKVSVVEGIVEVLQAEDPYVTEKNRPRISKDVLKAGDEVIATIGSTSRELGVVEPDSAATWRRGWLAYEDASLGEIVSDTNRYSTRQIVFESADIADLRVTAAFGADKIQQLILGLEASHSLRADYSNAETIILRKVN